MPLDLPVSEVAGSFMEAARDRATQVADDEYGPPAIDHSEVFEDLMKFFQWYKTIDPIRGAEMRCSVRQMAQLYARHWHAYKEAS